VNDVDNHALRACLAELTHPLTPSTRDGVKDAVCEYVARRHARGWPPERVIVALKQVAREAGLYPSHRVTADEHLSAPDKLLVEMVGWCIEAYYVPPS
jgi:hypothetical protein